MELARTAPVATVGLLLGPRGMGYDRLEERHVDVGSPLERSLELFDFEEAPEPECGCTEAGESPGCGALGVWHKPMLRRSCGCIGAQACGRCLAGF